MKKDITLIKNAIKALETLQTTDFQNELTTIDPLIDWALMPKIREQSISFQVKKK